MSNRYDNLKGLMCFSVAIYRVESAPKHEIIIILCYIIIIYSIQRGINFQICNRGPCVFEVKDNLY